MVFGSGSRVHRLFDATSQWLNVLLFNGDPNESISGRSYREKWSRSLAVIDSVLGKGHCKSAYTRDVERAKEIIDMDSERRE